MSDSRGLELRRLIVGGSPAAWSAAGFTVEDDSTVIGSVAVRFDGGAEPGISGWELAGLAADSATALDGADVDGIATSATDDPKPDPVTHPNGVTRLDHVVIRTPDLPRTIAALEATGFEVRRTREVPGSAPKVSQVFLWAGEAILEVVGRADAPTSDDGSPARIWGLALTTDDLDEAARLLAPNVTDPKPAVQPGRRIATINTAELGIGTALALMSPHPGRGRPQPDGE